MKGVLAAKVSKCARALKLKMPFLEDHIIQYSAFPNVVRAYRIAAIASTARSAMHQITR